MNNINILDCTLRDGGYVNQFNFGQIVIKDIIDKLSKASIDIIECGFLVSGAFDPEKSLFGSVETMRPLLQNRNPNLMYVAMIQYGAISIEEISDFDETSIDGIRLTFHQHEIDEAFVLGEKLMAKGYKVFMQPVGTMTYTDDALLTLIKRINNLQPFAFYIVDTLGTMYKKDLLHMFYLVNGQLNEGIALGFHSHNNLQLSFANAQELLQLNTKRKLIIDASVFGMGRGAGNLNTELITQYINDNMVLRYDNIQILEIIDQYIKPLSFKYKWGYDAAYYIAAVSGCHPNYASFLLEKQTLHIQDIGYILGNLDKERCSLFDKEYISQEYVKFMDRHIEDAENQEKLKRLIGNKKVLLIAPGGSVGNKTQEITALAETEEYFIITINFLPKDFQADMLFVSNMKRFTGIKEIQKNQSLYIAMTSNISTKKDSRMLLFDYLSYTNEESCIFDNSGLMCMNLLNRIGIKQIFLMGFDGFSINIKENYYNDAMLTSEEMAKLINVNEAMRKKVAQLKVQMDIVFLTKSAYN